MDKNHHNSDWKHERRWSQNASLVVLAVVVDVMSISFLVAVVVVVEA